MVVSALPSDMGSLGDDFRGAVSAAVIRSHIPKRRGEVMLGTLQTITPSEAHSKANEILLLDVRTPAEFEEARIDGAVLLPLPNLQPAQVLKLAHGKQSCVIVCRSGNRARQAAEKLRASGIASIYVLQGGLQAWESAGLPLTKGAQTVSLERQVRIASGALVFAGSLLAYLASPAWILLPMLIGAGLIFAGITDTCGMATALARMPWNTRCGRCSSR
jgi:rhodanese-related sulfurtransferase